MDKYATKEELKTLEAKIDGQFNTLDAHLDGHFNLIDERFKSIDSKLDANHKIQDEHFKSINEKFNSLPDKIKTIVRDSEDKQKKEISDNRKFIWGTLIIGGLATISSIASVIITLVK